MHQSSFKFMDLPPNNFKVWLGSFYILLLRGKDRNTISLIERKLIHHCLLFACLLFLNEFKAAQAIADGETTEEDLINDIPELQNMEVKIASKRCDIPYFCIYLLPLRIGSFSSSLYSPNERLEGTALLSKVILLALFAVELASRWHKPQVHRPIDTNCPSVLESHGFNSIGNSYENPALRQLLNFTDE